jgi:hypothetical protein
MTGQSFDEGRAFADVVSGEFDRTRTITPKDLDLPATQGQ